ncbi:MAG TPA: hypothetical protein VEI01_22620 [Terriglobales bacterium]|nr:hypothetical protein [Terriglobales bacterium]
MHRIVVIVFDNETEAEEGKNKLSQLDREGSIGIYGYAVVGKKADGTVVLRQVDRHGTLSPFANSLVGSLCDSACPAPESAATQAGDSAADSKRAKRGKDFIRDMTQILLPNRVAIVAEVEEEWPPVLDRRMESIGGVIFRWTVSEVQHAVDM